MLNSEFSNTPLPGWQDGAGVNQDPMTQTKAWRALDQAVVAAP